MLLVPGDLPGVFVDAITLLMPLIGMAALVKSRLAGPHGVTYGSWHIVRLSAVYRTGLAGRVGLSVFYRRGLGAATLMVPATGLLVVLRVPKVDRAAQAGAKALRNRVAAALRSGRLSQAA
ncbi:MAG: hypothetical protein AAF281_11380 [Pseudomonadota bacterium]